MKKPIFILLLSALSFTASGAIADLRPEHLSQLKSGKTVKKVIELKNEIWPQVTVIGLIPHSPKENVAVFTDFESHKTYIPDIKKSKIVKRVSPEETWIEYRMKMPWPIEDSEYVTSNVVKKEGQNYRVNWKLIRANQMKATTGTVLFEAYEGKTLMTYTTHITPDSSFAGMFKDRVEGDVEKTFKIIIDHLQKKLN